MWMMVRKLPNHYSVEGRYECWCVGTLTAFLSFSCSRSEASLLSFVMAVSISSDICLLLSSSCFITRSPSWALRHVLCVCVCVCVCVVNHKQSTSLYSSTWEGGRRVPLTTMGPTMEYRWYTSQWSENHNYYYHKIHPPKKCKHINWIALIDWTIQFTYTVPASLKALTHCTPSSYVSAPTQISPCVGKRLNEQSTAQSVKEASGC